jgi:hypothetical protein
LANGESTFDYIRVALVPADVQLTAGTSLPTGVTTTALPTGWIALDGGGKLNLVSDWENKTVTVPVAAGNYKIVLLWRDDSSGGTNPPAAIDNFSVVQAVCEIPTDLNASDITTSSATLDWTSDAEAWQLVYSESAEFDPSEATPVAVTSKPYILGNLLAETTYYYAVRTKCGDDFFSAWSAISSFATPAPCHDVLVDAESDTICSGEVYEWHGKSYEAAGTYYDTVPMVSGCDSIYTLVLAYYDEEDTIFVAEKIYENELPYTYQNAEHPYIVGEDAISFPEGTALGEHKATAYVEGEHCTAVLELTLTVEKSQGIDNIFGDGENVHKVLYRDVLYIVINDEWYTAEGKKVADPRE